MKCLNFITNTKKNLIFTAMIILFGIISFVYSYVKLYPLVDDYPKLTPIQENIDFERSLCDVKPKRRQLMYHTCPKNRIATVIQGGRLGNQIWEYASLLAYARKYKLEPYVPRCLLDRLELVFEIESFTVPALDEIAHCPMDWNNKSQSIVLSKWIILEENVLAWYKDVSKEFTYTQDLREGAVDILRAANKNHHKHPVYVGIHVRRTDYEHFLKQYHNVGLADAKYFHKAMDYFEQKNQSVVFVVVSDDADWCLQNLAKRQNVHIVGKNTSPGQDLAIMAACNHSIIDYGTFGLWGAIQAGGKQLCTKYLVIQLTKLPKYFQIGIHFPRSIYRVTNLHSLFILLPTYNSFCIFLCCI